MKAEERHELQENDLATWLQYGLINFLRQNGSYILLVLAFGFLGYQLWSLHERKQLDMQQNAWTDFRGADNLADQFRQTPGLDQADDPIKPLLDVIDKYDYKPVQAQANLTLGAVYDQLAARPEDLAKRKLSRQDAINSSYDSYQKALELAGTDNLVAGKATLGLAAAEEDRGHWDKARALYESMTDKSSRFAGTPFVALADDRLKTLNDREKAPRLAEMIPPPQPVRAPLALPSGTGILPSAIPSLTNTGGGLSLPGLPGSPGGAMPGSPFLGPLGPLGAPAGPPVPVAPTSTAPAK